MATIGIVANVYNEALALPGWLEMAHQFADHVAVYHAGPGGAHSDDGTIELLEKWRVPVVFGDIDEGFGAVRTKAARTSPCDWVVVLDADERFYAVVPELRCYGLSPTPPVAEQVLQPYDTPTENVCPWNWENERKLKPVLHVTERIGTVKQGNLLRGIIDMCTEDALVVTRRQWRDLTWWHPAQNWHTQPDYQARIIRNQPHVQWRNKMHESLGDAKLLSVPNLYIEHYHLWFKAMNPAQRARDIVTYRRIACER